MQGKIYFILMIIFILGCSTEGTKIYKVDYKENYPAGAIKASIGKETIFTNGVDILEVSVEHNPDFFCYAVNKESICSFKLGVKVSGDAAEKYRVVAQELKNNLVMSGKNRTTLPERLVYSFDGDLIEEVLFVDDVQNKSVNLFPITVSGTGVNEIEAQKNAVKKSKTIINILIDKN